MNLLTILTLIKSVITLKHKPTCQWHTEVKSRKITQYVIRFSICFNNHNPWYLKKINNDFDLDLNVFYFCMPVRWKVSYIYHASSGKRRNMHVNIEMRESKSDLIVDKRNCTSQASVW